MPDPQSPDDWLRLARQHELTARAMASSREAASQGFWHAGIAVEAALKAYIMAHERLNGWPSIDLRPELYTHDVRALMRVAGISVPRQGPVRASWQVALQWQRNQGYDPAVMPRKVAQGMVEAVFGVNGVVTWFRENMP